MTRLVQALVKSGLVEKSSDETDNRVVLLRATPAGRSTLDVARTRRLASLEELLSGLDADDAALVERAVSALEPLLRRS
jgi:DNA-binding MarR family transcriptional regulator